MGRVDPGEGVKDYLGADRSEGGVTDYLGAGRSGGGVTDYLGAGRSGGGGDGLPLGG